MRKHLAPAREKDAAVETGGEQQPTGLLHSIIRVSPRNNQKGPPRMGWTFLELVT